MSEIAIAENGILMWYSLDEWVVTIQSIITGSNVRARGNATHKDLKTALRMALNKVIDEYANAGIDAELSDKFKEVQSLAG